MILLLKVAPWREAVIVLPWAFKLVTGPLMDRFEFLPMGRHRPWVLAAQLGLSLSLLALM